MDMQWSEAELAFRDEVRAFLRERLTPELARAGALMTGGYADHDASMAWQQVLHERGWAAPSWGGEHGGQDWSTTQRYLFARELTDANAPSLSPMGLSMVAYVIMRFGTPAQKAYFLPRILTGEIYFCQGYSEPDAGSDLASLTTSAQDRGDGFIVNGAKTWTTNAARANWMFALVRTSREERKQAGITFILIDMRTPGVDVRPLAMATGEQVQAEVFFTDVIVPKDNVLGEIGQGWGVAKYLLEFERGGFAYAPAQQRRLRELAAFAAQAPGDMESSLLDEPLFESRLTEARMRADVLEVLELRVLSQASAGGSTGAYSSILKTLGTELEQHVTELVLEGAGPTGMAYQPHGAMPGGPVPDHIPPADGYVSGTTLQTIAPLRYLNARASSIYGGSNEIQRNIIAKAVLGL